MGYRSDVGLVIHFSSEDKPETAHLEYLQFQHWVKHDLAIETEDASTPETGVLRKYTYDDCMRQFEGYEQPNTMGWVPNEHLFMFHMYDVKWYPSFPEVRLIEALFHEARDVYATASYRFVGIGENYDDVAVDDHRGEEYSTDGCPEPWDLIEVHRSFSFPSIPESLTKEINV